MYISILKQIPAVSRLLITMRQSVFSYEQIEPLQLLDFLGLIGERRVCFVLFVCVCGWWIIHVRCVHLYVCECVIFLFFGGVCVCSNRSSAAPRTTTQNQPHHQHKHKITGGGWAIVFTAFKIMTATTTEAGRRKYGLKKLFRRNRYVQF